MRPPSDVLAVLAGAAGADAVRPAAEDDAIDGVRPAAVVEPATPEAAAGVLGAASAANLRLVIRGGGTKLDWGRTPAPFDAILGTRRLSRLLAHAHGDLTADVEAGAALDAVNRELMARRQWLPLEPPFAGATVGGTLATNDAGPVRHRFGTPRDLLIGVRLATPDGQLVNAGGHVVKNVAGYDVGRLVTGSFGSFALIVSATFKLTPAAAATATQRFVFDDRAVATAAAHGVAASQLDPIALDIHASNTDTVLLVRCASTVAVVEAEMAKATRLLTRFQPRVETPVTGAAEDALWHAHIRRPWERRGAVLKASWLPAALDAVIEGVAAVARDTDAVIELTGRAGVGAGLLSVEGTAASQTAVIQRLRDRGNLFERIVVLRASAAVKSAVDVWGGDDGTAPILAAIKHAFDPAGILNAGRGPV